LGRPLTVKAGTQGGPLTRANNSALTGSAAASAMAAAAAGDRPVQQKRGHSLAGNLGKFASGIARAGSGRDKSGKK